MRLPTALRRTGQSAFNDTQGAVADGEHPTVNADIIARLPGEA
jgi:hypothetical protein